SALFFTRLVSGAHLDGTGVEGVELTSRAMASAVSWFPYVLAFTVFLFAYSTLITWAYYGQKGLTYIFGEKPWLEMAYKIFFCGCVVIGTSANFDNIVSFTDAMILSLAFPNIVGLYMLAPEIKRDLKDYIAKLKKQR
ncbi:MAG TPA: alanine glycine permease, partial [Rhodospirillaceae bacterium]|nr:alanine glycine permease [Rhodospirillaceae bacterium]